jgi:hypothetical protein
VISISNHPTEKKVASCTWEKGVQPQRITYKASWFMNHKKCIILSKKGIINHMIILEEKSLREDTKTIISEAKGVGIILVRDLIFTVSIAERMDMSQRHAESLRKI